MSGTQKADHVWWCAPQARLYYYMPSCRRQSGLTPKECSVEGIRQAHSQAIQRQAEYDTSFPRSFRKRPRSQLEAQWEGLTAGIPHVPGVTWNSDQKRWGVKAKHWATGRKTQTCVCPEVCTAESVRLAHDLAVEKLNAIKHPPQPQP